MQGTNRSGEGGRKACYVPRIYVTTTTTIMAVHGNQGVMWCAKMGVYMCSRVNRES